MSTRKRNKLKAKRRQWSKTRSGRRAHARANCIKAVNSLLVVGKLDKMCKALLLAEYEGKKL